MATVRVARHSFSIPSGQNPQRDDAIELIHKLKKGQYGVPHSFGRFSRDIWRNVLAA
jgi:hypothetical protein